jgi:hypothetical protein
MASETSGISPEGIVFGNGHHLPSLEALDGFDFEANRYPQSREVAALPDHPDSVVRIEYENHDSYGKLFTKEGYYDFARLGIANFIQLQQQGLRIPAQRFVVGPSIIPVQFNPLRLYAFTEKIEGRPLTYDTEDAEASAPVISSLSRYMSDILERSKIIPPRFMSDLAYPDQYTRQDDGEVVLHDAGLEIAFRNTANDRMIRRQIGMLALWSKVIRLPQEYTGDLQLLIRNTRQVFPDFDPEEVK